jgi:hypothetical protein
MIVKVPWSIDRNHGWNFTCATIMEHFGLPGNRYVTNVNVDCIDFIFYDDRDALMCKILVSETV